MKKIIFTLLLIVNYNLSVYIYLAIYFLFQNFLPHLPLHVRVPLVARMCSARFTFVFRALHVRVTLSRTRRLEKKNINHIKLKTYAYKI